MVSVAEGVVKECKQAFPAAVHVLTASPQFALEAWSEEVVLASMFEPSCLALNPTTAQCSCESDGADCMSFTYCQQWQ